MSSLSGKTAIVTGGTSGMGEGVALKFAEEGANVLISGRDEERGEATVQKILKKGGSAFFIPGDISGSKANKKLVEVAVSDFGRLDIVVLSAGRLGLGKITELPEEEWLRTIDVNLNSVFYIMRYAIPEMLINGGGNIVIIGSVAAFHAFPGHAAYCASKGALISLVRQVAADYGPEIRINLLCPAQVDTPLLRSSVRAFDNSETIIRQTEAKLPMKRLGTTSDIADAVHFLASDSSSWITGSCLTIDGGFLCT